MTVTRERVTPYTTNTMGKIQTWHPVLLCTVYNSWLHHSYAQQGYTEWAATPSSCVKVPSKVASIGRLSS